MKERRVWHLLMQIPTVTGCISLFQFCSETSVENKSASFFCCSVQASLLLYVCKYNQPACIKAARQEEFPLKKKRTRPGSALLNKNGSHASPIWGPLCRSHSQTPDVQHFVGLQSPHQCFSFTAAHTLPCITTANVGSFQSY